MNLGQIRTELRNIINQSDSSNSDFTNAQLDIWINESYRFILTKLDAIPYTERTYTAGSAATMTLNSNTLGIDHARLDVQPAGEWTSMKIIDYETLIGLDPDFENTDTGVPQYMVRTGTFSIRLYPAPNTDNTGQDFKTAGLEFPSALSGDVDIPDLPLNMHDVMPHFGAYRAFQKLGDEQRAVNEFTLTNSLLKAQHSITSRFSKSQNQWKFMEGHDGDGESTHL